jgi:predicted transcriptional regulator of viral defense system
MYRPLPPGISAANRSRLELIHRRAPAPLNSAEAAELWGVGREEARRLLGYLARHGWLARVRRGLYIPVPLEARQSGQWNEDPWIVAVRAFSPCYVGGWSACEHWGLTEQLFRDLVVLTVRPVRDRHPDVQGTPIRLKSIRQDHLFGTRSIWRSSVQVPVSDPSRTVVDILDDPTLGGGIRHVASIVREYFATDLRDDSLLISYADRVGNGTVFKRLGYLIEALGIDAEGVVAACRERRSKGLTALDPSVKDPGRIVRRWGLRINVDLRPDGTSS